MSALYGPCTFCNQRFPAALDPGWLVSERCPDCAKPDTINRPSHYVKGGMEARHVIRAWELTYHCGDAVAYILRAKFKGNYVEDLRKAIQHLEFELEEETKK